MSLSSLEICDRPVFIIGSPRSGTSALAWSLAQHSNLWTSPETDFFYELFGRREAEAAISRAASRPGTWLQEHGVQQDELLQALGSGVNAMITRASGGRRWIDQTPLYTLMVETLAKMYPHAQFVHILRDGRDVVRSMLHFSERFGPELGSHLPNWATSAELAARTWRQFVESALRHAATMPTRVYTVRNEDLTARPESEFDKLFSFLGEDYEPQPARFFSTSRINSSFAPLVWGSTTAGSGEAARTTAIIRPEVEARVERTVALEIGALLEELGYCQRRLDDPPVRSDAVAEDRS